MSKVPEAEVGKEGNWYVLVANLPHLHEPFVLAPGISLRPLEFPLDVFDLAAVGSVGFREWAAIEPIIGRCTCEIESACDAGIQGGLNTLNRAWLALGLLVLRGFTDANGVACSSYAWSAIPIPGAGNGWSRETRDVTKRRCRTDLPPFKGNLLDYHLGMLKDDTIRNDPLNGDDAEWIRQHFETFNGLATENEQFYFAFQAAVDWRYCKDCRTAVARIWSGIEAIFGISSELIYRLSLLTASLLEPRGEERKSRFYEVKKLYGLRSKVVHGEQLPNEKIVTALNESYHLLRDLLLLIIERGRMLSSDDFDDAVFN